jgi:hypothetical protein
MIQFVHNLPWQVVMTWEFICPSVAFYAGLRVSGRRLSRIVSELMIMRQQMNEKDAMCRRMESELRLWVYKYGSAGR